MPERRPIQYVGTSSVREDVVAELDAGPKTTGDLLESLAASESAVYDALTALDRRTLVEQRSSEWRLTGSGQLVADTLDRQRATERLLTANREYWDKHDTTVLPREFRCRLCQIDDCEILRAEETDLNRQVRRVADRVESVDACDVASPVYHEAYEEALPDHEGTRLIVAAELVDRGDLELAQRPQGTRFEHVSVRVTELPFALGVASGWLILTLPQRDGQWARATLISESKSAVQWGRDLFDTLWSDARSLETYLSRN